MWLVKREPAAPPPGQCAAANKPITLAEHHCFMAAVCFRRLRFGTSLELGKKESHFLTWQKLKSPSSFFLSSCQHWSTHLPFPRRLINILAVERTEWFADLVFCPWGARWCHRCLAAFRSLIFLPPRPLSARAREEEKDLLTVAQICRRWIITGSWFDFILIKTWLFLMA